MMKTNHEETDWRTVLAGRGEGRAFRSLDEMIKEWGDNARIIKIDPVVEWNSIVRGLEEKGE